MVKELFIETEKRMKKAIQASQHELAMIRTAKATTSLLDGIKVDYYGTSVPINQVAAVSVPEPRMLVVQPWEKNMIGEIEKALLKSDLGLTPNSDGTVIRLPIPALTQERRGELVKVVHRLAEEGRVAIRNVRRDANDQLRDAEKTGDLPQDDSKRAQEHIQELTDKHTKLIDEIVEAKEKEIMEV
ncbi:ribosome recycling factor [bacterium]|nr:ribosome recycling factor [bacterium]